MTQRRLVKVIQRYAVNPIAKIGAGVLPGPLLLETTGRRSGRPRRTPVGAQVEGDTMWIVSEYGREANYVRNIQADPHVRVRVRGRWRSGIATLQTDDDPRARLRRHKTLSNLIARAVGTDLLTIRIQLDPL